MSYTLNINRGLFEKNTDNIVTMHGRSLASTIETMEALGAVGEEVLKKFGILKIDERKTLSYRNSKCYT